jgi:osmotically-inducible protein OsmY
MTEHMRVILGRGVLGVCLGILPAAPAVYGGQQSSQPTADSQGNHKPDVETTAQIRKALQADHALSVAAHNVKVITKNGTVTLRGHVKTDEERTSIGQKAEEIAGKGNVTNELTVTPAK